MDSHQIKSIYQSFLASTGICTDTRKFTKDCLFIALTGENFNGNLYCYQALESGANAVVTDDEKVFLALLQLGFNQPIFYVEDALLALQTLAKHHRLKFDIPVIAVCGSNGKTTTKELIVAALNTNFRVWATPGNFNNHIGVPLTLLQLNANHQIAVVEMGANHPLEIALLADIAQPTHGLITNIGKDHLEGFGSVEGVAKANAELFSFLADHKGIAFINSQEPFLADLAKGITNNITFPEDNDSYHFKLHSNAGEVGVTAPDGTFCQTQLIGSYNFNNICTAFVIAKTLGIAFNDAAVGIAKYSPKNNRSQKIITAKNIIFLDAYNANPSSVAAALDNLKDFNVPKDVVIIMGDMLELGSYSTSEHEALIDRLKSLNAFLTIIVGPEMHKVAYRYPTAKWMPDTQEAANYLISNPCSNKYVLLKGSRGIALEKLLPAIQ